MDQNNNLPFSENGQQFNAYDSNLNNFFPNGADSTFTDAGWGVNASGGYGNASRGQLPAVNGWQQNANHLSVPSSHPAYNGQASPYGRTLNQSPVQFNQGQHQNFSQQQQHQNFPPYQNSQYQSLFSQPGTGQNFNATITPQALERGANFGGSPYANQTLANNNYGQTPPLRPSSSQVQARSVNPKALVQSIPKGASSGMFNIINFDTLAHSSNTERMGNYVNIGKEPIDWGCTKGIVPVHAPRKSRNELRAIAAQNPTALAKIGKKSSKKNYPTLLSDIKSASASASSMQGIKYEHDPSSSDDSSSDDDSEYTDDDDEDSPLPAKRPDNPKDGVEYDTIKAVWRSKRKTLTTDSIRKGLVEFWELIKPIRDRWKKDAQDVADAEEKKQTGQLPLLQSRVKDQRDMIETAFKAALKHGHRGLIELLAENVSLMYLCYQVLLDRFKADDLNGGLSRVILETVSLSTTLTNDKIEKTHLDKVLNRYAKKGDAKTQFYAKKIMQNADVADKEAAIKAEKKKSDGANGEKTAGAPSKKAAPEPVAGVKRSALTSTADGTSPKKVATAASKANGTTAASKVNGVVKKSNASSETAKSATANPTTTRKTVVAKPSGFFSNLQSASKKPGTSNADKAASAAKSTGKAPGTGAPVQKPAFSFAETMAKIAKPKSEQPVAKAEKDGPPETPEQKEKRLSREKRGATHVTFKTGEDLVEIRYFAHDPQEEIGHDSSQMRDMADVGGEGRVLKQQAHMMDIDDEDEVNEEDETLTEWTTPSLVDFSVVDSDERKRNYAPYGGGEREPESVERAVRNEYENNNLIVFYTDPSQIPPNPREPIDPYNGAPGQQIKTIGAPDEKYFARARAKRSQQSKNPATDFDLSAFMKKQQPQTQPQQAAPVINPEVMSILASLQKATPAQAPPKQPAPPFNQPYIGAPQPPVQAPPPPPPPPGVPNLGAILASLGVPNAQQGNFGAPNGAPPMMGFQQQQMGNTNTSMGGNTRMRDNARMGGNEPNTTMIQDKHPNYKTKVCKYWPERRCQKGDSCSFLHN